MHTVVAVLVDGVAAFELGVACEVFGLSRPELNVPWYDFLVCAAEPPPLRSTGGMLIDTPPGLSALAAADTLVFPSWRSPAERPPEALLEAVRRADARGARLVSICSGVFILSGADSVEDVAEHSGFGSAAALRMHFRRTFGTSPQAYRRQFGPGPAPRSS
jgi:AraC family transcriptional regulator, transcriptional activator FtrA